MKHLFLSLVTMAVFSFSANAQTVNNVLIKDIDVQYMQIVGSSKMMSNKVSINLDFGQHNRYLGQKDTQVKDENGKLVVFNSMIDALNFFAKYGYGFVDAYIMTTGGQNVYHYILKKEQ